METEYSLPSVDSKTVLIKYHNAITKNADELTNLNYSVESGVKLMEYYLNPSERNANRYLSSICSRHTWEETYIPMCDNCNIKLKTDDDKSYYCKKCGAHDVFYIDNEIGREGLSVSHHLYSTKANLMLCLDKICGIDRTPIPQSVYEKINKVREKHGSLNKSLNIAYLHIIMKEAKLTKYHPNIYKIHNTICRKEALRIEQYQIDAIQEVFSHFESIYREISMGNMISYTYVIYKICELFNDSSYDEIMRRCKKEMSNDVMAKYRMVWRRFCDRMGYKCI